MSQTLDAVPFPDPPGRGQAIAVAPGVLWLKLPLPFRLNHVNVYLVEDGDGWLLIDCGAGDAPTQALWAELLEGDASSALGGRPITRILATHHHPDHVGAASFLAARTGAPLLMGETEYLIALHFMAGDASEGATVRERFYKQHGLDEAQRAMVAGHLPRYRAVVPDLPRCFQGLRHGDTIAVGRRTLLVMDLPGHSPAQIVLHSAGDNILFAADHVMTRISPNISVTDRNPDDDPLGRYLASLGQLRAAVPDGGLVLPGHHLPFCHLHRRTIDLARHHAERCDAVEAACRDGKGRTVGDIVPALFPFALDAHQFWFAFSEILAHLNHLARLGRLEPRASHGRCRWGVPGRVSHGV